MASKKIEPVVVVVHCLAGTKVALPIQFGLVALDQCSTAAEQLLAAGQLLAAVQLLLLLFLKPSFFY